MSLWAVLLTGLFAGGASCAAVQGGLLTGVVARRRQPERVLVGGRGRRKPPPPPPRPAFRDDAVPVASFLGGKLVSHALLGAALGALGDAVQLGVTTRSIVQIAAGLMMIVIAADLLGVTVVRRLVPSPPAAWTRLVRRNARWGSAFAPATLGAATVLIPCGVTLGMEFLAIASGSPLAGAAIMTTFVVGTTPLFAAIGYAARRTSAMLRGRLSMLAAVAVAISGVISLNAGLVLSDSSVTLGNAWSTVTGADNAAQDATADPSLPLPTLDADGVQRIALTASDSGYSADVARIRAGVPTELVVTTNNTLGCTRVLVIPSTGDQEFLPETGETAIALGVLSPGTFDVTCGMGMYSASFEVLG